VTEIVVFTGPTIAPSAARQILEADYRAPAKTGDVLLAAQRRPNAIAIIDGLFESVPSVWHKEILFALSEGVHVYGASSMGALRAAELHTFGMVGVGRIFEAYRSGLLEDDDEVAVAQGPTDEGSVVLSEAMVNIREGLRLASAGSIISPETHDKLSNIAKAMHFTERAWTVILRAATREGLPTSELDGLRDFLKTVDTNLKRQDATQLLHRLASDATKGLPAFKPEFQFERTSFFEALRNSLHQPLAESAALERADLFQFANLQQNGRASRISGLLSLVMAEGQRRGIDVSYAQIREHAKQFFAQRGLKSMKEIESWLQENQLSLEDFRELIRLDAWIETIGKDRKTER
jgi:hypothetical protein